eukprot:jgi/Undpi1/12863/HiC_scaffold_7.g02530.m1
MCHPYGKTSHDMDETEASASPSPTVPDDENYIERSTLECSVLSLRLDFMRSTSPQYLHIDLRVHEPKKTSTKSRFQRKHNNNRLLLFKRPRSPKCRRPPRRQDDCVVSARVCLRLEICLKYESETGKQRWIKARRGFGSRCKSFEAAGETRNKHKRLLH